MNHESCQLIRVAKTDDLFAGFFTWQFTCHRSLSLTIYIKSKLPQIECDRSQISSHRSKVSQRRWNVTGIRSQVKLLKEKCDGWTFLKFETVVCTTAVAWTVNIIYHKTIHLFFQPWTFLQAWIEHILRHV